MTKEVYRIVTAEGHEYDYHGGAEHLKQDHPGAVITGRRVVDTLGQGSYEPYRAAKAQFAARKAQVSEGDAPKAPARAVPVKSDKDKPPAKKGDEAGPG